MLSIYERQTQHRDDLRQESKKLLDEIVKEINAGNYTNSNLEDKLKLLADRLSRTKGKKQYGYLKRNVKNLVDSIVDELSSDEKISALYKLWYRQREDVIRIYTENMPDRVPLSQNKEFKSVRNAVVQAAMNIIAEQRRVDYCHIAMLRLLGEVSSIIQDKIEDDYIEISAGIDTKQWREINEKKQAHGLKQG